MNGLGVVSNSKYKKKKKEESNQHYALSNMHIKTNKKINYTVQSLQMARRYKDAVDGGPIVV